MNDTTRFTGLSFFVALAAAALQTGCTSGLPNDLFTGQLDIALSAPDVSATGDLISSPPGAGVLTISTTGWNLSELFVGRCAGTCDEAAIDAWLIERADALYGLGYGCPAHEACTTHPNEWGFKQVTYGTCPPNVTSKTNPVFIDPELGLVDEVYVATDCSAPAPALEEGVTYYVTGIGEECTNDDIDRCSGIHGVRFFRMEGGQLVDVAGTTDDRRPLLFDASTSAPDSASE